MALLGTAASLCVSLIAAWLALALPAWRTGARVLPWYDAAGAPLARQNGNGYQEAVDIGMDLVIQGRFVWTWIRTPELEAGALVRIDVIAGEGRVLWSAPKEVPFGGNTVGLFPRGESTLGVVYREGGATGPLAVGIAGPDGWTSPPIALPGKTMSRLLGGAFVDDKLELAVLPADASGHTRDFLPLIVRVESGKATITKPFETRDALCEGIDHCWGPEVAMYRDGGWNFVVSGRLDSDDGSHWVRPGRGPVATRWPTAGIMLRAQVDFVSVGSTEVSLASWQLERDGTLAPFPAPPRNGWGESVSRQFIVRDGRLERIPRFLVSSDPYVVAQRVSGRLVGMRHAGDSAPPLVLAQEYPSDGEPVATAVGHAPSYACGDLGTGTLVPSGGGFSLVSRGGCLVRLDAELRRVDPLPLTEHLRRRGSLGMDWDERRHALLLAYACFGLPLLLLIALGPERMRRQRGRAGVLRALGGAGLAHAVTGAFVVVHVWTLLR